MTLVGDALNDRGRAIRGASVLVLGVTYKPDVNDIRESPALEIIEMLERKGAHVSYADPFTPQLAVEGGKLTAVEPTAGDARRRRLRADPDQSLELRLRDHRRSRVAGGGHPERAQGVHRRSRTSIVTL